MARGPSPRDEAARTRRRRDDDDLPPRRRRDEADAPWLEEGEFEDGPTHTLVGRGTFWALLFGLAVLVVGVIVGIMLVSGREETPIDVPAVGEDVPVLASPGPWKIPPEGPDVDGIPVEGTGQVLYGTGDGRDPEARIALDALPEDPLPRPGELTEEELAQAPAPAAAPPGVAPPVAAPAAKAPEKPGPKLAVPKTIYAPEPEPAASGNGTVLQLGAFSSESRARSAFKSLSERFSYLAGMEPLIVPTTRDGKTLYRLRSSAGSAADAKEICGRLRVAGEACTVVD
jgi:cell division septation protein DedD